MSHDDVIKWKHFPRYWPFVRGIQWCYDEAHYDVIVMEHDCICLNVMSKPKNMPVFTLFDIERCWDYMMTSSNGNIFRVTDPLCGEFTGPGEFPAQRPVTRSFDVFFHLRLNKRLSKQPRGWWFETPAWSLWRHRNDLTNWNHRCCHPGWVRNSNLHYFVTNWYQERENVCHQRHNIHKRDKGMLSWMHDCSLVKWYTVCRKSVRITKYSNKATKSIKTSIFVKNKEMEECCFRSMFSELQLSVDGVHLRTDWVKQNV